MIQLTIDDKLIEVPEGTTVLRAAELAGIHIPTLCDHPELTPTGGCRLCMVEIDGFRGPTTSCTLPAAQGMVVHTDTPALKQSRQFILTMLFSERNHFCPFCEASGGDCELQNAAYAQGMTHWEYQPGWKPFPLDASHPDIIIDHNRCILCRRCIRACDELVGVSTLGTAQRGAHTMLVADTGAPLGESTCVSCGMCVQVCPTGAIIDRSSAYLGHDAQLTHTRTICLGCSVGCGIVAQTRDNRLVSIDGDWDSPVNEGLTCRLGRFDPLHEERTRIQQPLIRKNGALQPASWDEALDAAAKLLQPAPGRTAAVAAVASTRLSAESLGSFKAIFQVGLNSDVVTTVEDGLPTAWQAALAAENGARCEGDLSCLDTADCVLLVGANPTDRHAVLSFKIKRRLGDGLRLIVVDPKPGYMADLADRVLQPAPGGDAEILSDLELAVAAGRVGSPTALEQAAEMLRSARQVLILYGKGITAQETPDALKALQTLAARLPGAALLSVKGEANSLAASQFGLDRRFETNGHEVVYLALGDDYPNQRLLGNLRQAPACIVQTAYASEATEMAEVVLPVGTWAEQSGHYLNLDGRLQKAEQFLNAPEGVRSNRDALHALAARLGLPDGVDWRTQLLSRVAPVELKIG
jgi:formate dehydrogenase major subunit